MSVNFNEILDRAVGSSPKPKPLPIGTYMVVIKDSKIKTDVGPDKKAVLEYNCVVLSPGPDVDQTQLAEVPGGFQGKFLKLTFWLEEGTAIFKLESFLKDVLGITGMSNKQAIPTAVGRQLMVHARHRVVGEDVFADVDSYSKV